MWTNGNKHRQIKININLENGLWNLDLDSATGKTRLLKVLKDFEDYGEPVVGYTYNDYLANKFDLRQYLDIKQPKVIMFDRYDKYSQAYGDVLEKWRDKAIVLVDSKSDFNLPQIDDLTTISMRPDSIEVHV